MASAGRKDGHVAYHPVNTTSTWYALKYNLATVGALAADTTNVYVVLPPQAIVQLDYTGGTLNAGGPVGTTSIALDAKSIYFAAAAPGPPGVWLQDKSRFPAAATQVTLAKSPVAPHDVAVDDACVYWLDGNGVHARAKPP